MNKTVVAMATYLLTLVLWVPMAMSDRIGLNPDEPGYDPRFQFFNPFNWYDEVSTITVRDTTDKDPLQLHRNKDYYDQGAA